MPHPRPFTASYARSRARSPRAAHAAAGFVLFAGSAALALTAACGGSAARSEAIPVPNELARAEADLELAERKLAPILGRESRPRPDLQPPTSPAPPERPEPGQTGPKGATAMSDADACETACEALASMKRAAERICALDPDRCSDARARVERATERVLSQCHDCEL